jgi:hypothetical protein
MLSTSRPLAGRDASRPLAGRDASRPLIGRDPSGTSSRIRNFSYSRRALGRGLQKNFGTSRPLDGRDVPSPTPPARSTGGRHPFFKLFPAGTPFRILIFFNPFFKKSQKRTSNLPARKRPINRPMFPMSVG